MNTRSAVALTALMMGALMCAAPTDARDFRVNSRKDAPDTRPGDGICDVSGRRTRPVCTLRAAIMEANARVGKDAILLHSGHYTLTLEGAGENGSLTGDLDITDSVEILGEDPDHTIIDGKGLDRVIEVVGDNLSVSIEKLTVKGGRIQAGDSGSGGVDVSGTSCTVSLYKSQFVDNAGTDGTDDGLCMHGGTLKVFHAKVHQSADSVTCGAVPTLASL